MDAPEPRTEGCPGCGQSVRDALVVCGHCGQVLPLRVVVVSEGSHGGGWALVAVATEEPHDDEEGDE